MRAEPDEVRAPVVCLVQNDLPRVPDRLVGFDSLKARFAQDVQATCHGFFCQEPCLFLESVQEI